MRVGDRIQRAWSRHAGLRSALKVPPWAAGLAALAVVVVAVVLALAGLPGPISGLKDIAPSLVTNLATGLVLGLLAYLWFYFWTSERTTHHLRDAASRRPERL